MTLTWIAKRLQSARSCKADAETDTEQAWWSGYESAMREVWGQESNGLNWETIST